MTWLCACMGGKFHVRPNKYRKNNMPLGFRWRLRIFKDIESKWAGIESRWSNKQETFRTVQTRVSQYLKRQYRLFVYKQGFTWQHRLFVYKQGFTWQHRLFVYKQGFTWQHKTVFVYSRGECLHEHWPFFSFFVSCLSSVCQTLVFEDWEMSNP